MGKEVRLLIMLTLIFVDITILTMVNIDTNENIKYILESIQDLKYQYIID